MAPEPAYTCRCCRTNRKPTDRTLSLVHGMMVGAMRWVEVMKHIDVKGARIPALGFGTWRLSGATCEQMVRVALELGYRHIDTADAYDNEEHVGAGIKRSNVPREDIFLTTKVWMTNLQHDAFVRSCETSLRRLRTDYIDLILVHWPNAEIPLSETLDAMNTVRETGKVRHLGVSNFPVALLKQAAEIQGADLLCNQVEYHPYLSQKPVLDYLAAHDMMLTAYSPLARGDVMRDPTLVRLGERHGRTPAQIALRWLIQQDRVAAIPKASGREHCLHNLSIFDFELSGQEMNEIFGLARGERMIDPEWAPAWDAA